MVPGGASALYPSYAINDLNRRHRLRNTDLNSDANCWFHEGSIRRCMSRAVHTDCIITGALQSLTTKVREMQGLTVSTVVQYS